LQIRAELSSIVIADSTKKLIGDFIECRDMGISVAATLMPVIGSTRCLTFRAVGLSGDEEPDQVVYGLMFTSIESLTSVGVVQIPRLINLFQGEMTAWRQDLHAHPELGFEERRTSEFVADKHSEFGCEVHRNIGKTGVISVLRAGNGPSI
jgi:hypothetical protein